MGRRNTLFAGRSDVTVEMLGSSTDGGFQVKNESGTLAEVIRLPAMEKGKNKKPHRFGRPSRGNLDLDGYSDHFPVGVRVGGS